MHQSIFNMVKAMQASLANDSSSRLNVHITSSNFLHATRILKITKSLISHDVFNRILIVACSDSGLPAHEIIDSQRDVYRISTFPHFTHFPRLTRIIGLLFWMLRVLWVLRNYDIQCVSCHSLTILPLCVMLKMMHGAKLVYETHELETQTSHAVGIYGLLLKFIERILINCNDSIIVVNDSIKQWYKHSYPSARFYTVKNIPDCSERASEISINLKALIGIPSDEIAYLYLGKLVKGRGIDILLDIFSQVDNQKHIIFIGFGPLEERILKMTVSHSNIHYYPAVSPSLVVSYASGADVGISLIENVSLSYFYSLPNKFCEYIKAGIPVIASNFPEMASVIDKYQCGWKTPVCRSDVFNLIQNITAKDIEEKKKHVSYAQNFLNWEQEEIIIIEAYQG